MIVADQTTPYRLLNEIIYSCGQAGYANYRLLVLKAKGESRLGASPLAPLERRLSTRAAASGPGRMHWPLARAPGGASRRIRIGSDRTDRVGSARFGSVRLGSVRLAFGSARLRTGPDGLSATRVRSDASQSAPPGAQTSGRGAR